MISDQFGVDWNLERDAALKHSAEILTVCWSLQHVHVNMQHIDYKNAGYVFTCVCYMTSYIRHSFVGHSEREEEVCCCNGATLTALGTVNIPDVAEGSVVT